MSEFLSNHYRQEPPAMGERRARWGYGYQDKVATERILDLLRKDLVEGKSAFQGVRLADLDAGRVDDFVLVWEGSIEGNSIKWSGNTVPINWSDLIGASGLVRELANGYQRLRNRWPDKIVSVRLQTNRPPSLETHHSQLISKISVAEFLKKHWHIGPTDLDSGEIEEVWRRIAEHIGITGSSFLEFVASCHLSLGIPEPPGPGEDSVDWKHYKQQFDSLHKAIATWLTDNPDSEFIDREFLLEAIGFRPSRQGLIQTFPHPEIPYERNSASAEQLKELIERTPGGYVAVVGPAGVGKSTLVQDVLTDSTYPYFIPYYAFLPNIDGNRDRGEALTFFQDVIGRLDRFSGERSSLGISDLTQGRDALRNHMRKANERYVVQGHKTILLIDGLDHVSREVNLQHPVLNELPLPNEVPDGFLIILSGQPQAFVPGTIPVQVASVAEETERRIEVSGLSRMEIHALISKIDKPTTGAERDALHDACLGNPLILTYLLTHFERKPETTIGETIELAGHYTGPIDLYYRERLDVPLQKGSTRSLLGLLCRAAPTIPVEWLQEWPEKHQIEDLCQEAIAPFIRIDERAIHFIHDSLIVFLRSETRSRLPGSNAVADEKEFHSILADRCSGRPCSDPLGRARIFHLLRAERNNELVNQLSTGWLREAVRAFLPYALIRPVIVSGLKASWITQQFGQVLRLILLDHELDQRTSRSEVDTLAEAFLKLNKPDLALSQIRASGRMLVDDNLSLGFSAQLWWYADKENQPDLKLIARILYLQAKPISLIYQAEPIDTIRQHDYYKILEAWAEAAPLFEDPITIVTEIEKLALKSSENWKGMNTPKIKANLLFRALNTAVSAEIEASKLQLFIDRLGDLKMPTWRFACLLCLAEAKSEAVPFEVLQATYREARPNNDISLAYAWFLFRQHHHTESREIVSRLNHLRFKPYEERHSWGFSDITYTAKLRCLQELLNLSEGDLPGVKDEAEEAYARIEAAARQLGQLRALSEDRRTISGLDVVFRSLLLFHNQTVLFKEFDWRNEHSVVISKIAIYREILSLATSIGPEAVTILRDVFLDLIHGPAGEQFTPDHRRLFAAGFFEERALSREDAIKVGLSSTADTANEDPGLRQEACLEIAKFLHLLNDDIGSRKWIERASEVSAGTGSHKDYHMAYVAEWLKRSIHCVDSAGLALLDKFARAVEIAGGRGKSDASSLEIQLLLKLHPFLAARFAVEIIDRQVLNVAETIEALITGGAKSGASAGVLNALYSEFHLLIASDDSSASALAVLHSYPIERRREVAEQLMKFVRTNALSSHRLMIARKLQDALLQDGLGKVYLAQGLRGGRDDSSRRSMLYRLLSGEVETIDQIAARLSDDEHPEQWNPNPAENNEFDWLSAFKKTQVRSIPHLEDLLARFPQPDYREVERLAWRSRCLGRLGDSLAAKQLADEALHHARDASWHSWLDGAQKRIAYDALKHVDHDEMLNRAHEEFGVDLGSGKLNSSFLLSDVLDTFDLLEIAWPAEDVRYCLADYLDNILAANQKVSSYRSLMEPSSSCSQDEALVRFTSHLLTFPVMDVGINARRFLARYVAEGGPGIIDLLTRDSWWDPVQLEHILAAVHVGSQLNSNVTKKLKTWILNQNNCDSIAVRSIAKRISEEQGWTWTDITDQPAQPVILLPRDIHKFDQSRMIVGADIDVGWHLHERVFNALEKHDLDIKELRSEFERIYQEIEKEYLWVDNRRLKRWMKSVLARLWLKPRAIIGREAAMRVFGRHSLSGQIPPGAEQAYNYFYPIYDPQLELLQPEERPSELSALDWKWGDNRGESWRNGEQAADWNHYPESTQGLRIIGERSWFIKREWEWPREERHRGLVVGPLDLKAEYRYLDSHHELTYETYLNGITQNRGQLIVMNPENQLIGPAYRWIAINSNFARELGWHPSKTTPFEWCDSSGNLTVKSIYWKDGWIWLEPPGDDSLGEGWLVLATNEAIDAIRRLANTAEMHLWIERHSHGDKPYEGKWHIFKEM